MIKDRIDVLKEIFVKWLQSYWNVAFSNIVNPWGFDYSADVWIWMICISGSYLLGLVEQLSSEKPRYAHIVAGILINTVDIITLSRTLNQDSGILSESLHL